MLQVKSKTEEKAQDETPVNSTDSQREKFKFSDVPIKPVRSDKNSSVSDGDRQEATQEQHAQCRLLRRADRVSVLLIRCG